MISTKRYINVRAFGAKGDGVTDDWAAINAAVGSSGNTTLHGTIYFPPGTYLVSQSIVADTNAEYLFIEGEPGAVITGNFNDFLIKYLFNVAANSGVQRGVIERLKLVNTHATGGGIRYATCTGGTIRDCIITANRGIYLSIDDLMWVPFETGIENCHLDPGANPSGSLGLLLGANGPVNNCTITGYEVGARMFGGQGGMQFQGCKFELCGSGILPGSIPTGFTAVTQYGIKGCYFLNNGTGMYTQGFGGSSDIAGLQIIASNGTIAGNPQYGFRVSSSSKEFVEGISIQGQYAVAGFRVPGGDPNLDKSLFAGIGSVNTGAGVAYTMPSTGTGGKFLACGAANVITTIPTGAANLVEGDEFNVSNSNTAVWGATYATGGANHVKVRYNGTNFTVVGK